MLSQCEELDCEIGGHVAEHLMQKSQITCKSVFKFNAVIDFISNSDRFEFHSTND